MPSTKKDIQVGAIFRPRMGGSQCIKMRKADTVEICCYTTPDVLVSYKSDKFQFIVRDDVLLAEYKLSVAPAAKATPIAPHTTPTVAASVPSQKQQTGDRSYPIGSTWVCLYSGCGFAKDLPFIVSRMDSDGTVTYRYVHNTDLTNYSRSRTDFDAFAVLYNIELNTKPQAAAAPVQIPVGQPIQSMCQHKHTSWYGDIESCTDCGDTIRTLQCNNPYNVDPDLKTIHAAASAFMNRYGQNT